MEPGMKNPVLSRACAKIREHRPLVPDTLNFLHRVERIGDAPFVTLWFRTRGCSHDYQGGCTMCNYGRSTPVSASQIVDYVRSGLEKIEKDNRMNLLISPSGSMFDEKEVPAEARTEIFHIVKETPGEIYTCESRVETLTEQKVREFATIIDNKIACIEVGLESSDPWILKYCVNKALSLSDYQRAMNLLHTYNVTSITNVMLGTAFLSPKEAIEDAVTTIQWAFAQGTDYCVLFPAHVKAWTLLEWLWRNNLYTPPSLWSLVEVLGHLGPQLAPKVSISWYKVYREEWDGIGLDPVEDLGILASPTTCNVCRQEVFDLLDAYRDNNDFAVIQTLVNFSCDCKRTWQASIEADEPTPLRQRVEQYYKRIDRELLGTGL